MNVHFAQTTFLPNLLGNHFENKVRELVPQMGSRGGKVVVHYLVAKDGTVSALVPFKPVDGSTWRTGKYSLISRVAQVYQKVDIGRIMGSQDSLEVLGLLYRNAGIGVSHRFHKEGHTGFFAVTGQPGVVTDSHDIYSFQTKMGESCTKKAFKKSKAQIGTEHMLDTWRCTLTLSVSGSDLAGVITRLNGMGDRNRALAETIERIILGR